MAGERANKGGSPPKRSPARAKGGRPEKISQEVVTRITTAIRAGAFIETAAAHGGIHKDTLYAWMKKGASSRRPGCPYRAFSDAVQKALADAELGHLGNIAGAARGAPARAAVLDQAGRVVQPAQPAILPQWQASAWWLERRYPERYARRVYHVEDASPGPAPAPAGEASTGVIVYLPAEDPLPGAPQLPPSSEPGKK